MSSRASSSDVRGEVRTLTAEQIADAASRIDVAERTGKQIGQLSLQYPAMNIEDAYAVQRAWVAMKLAAGRRLRGHKVGLTSRAMQQSSQINEPDFGDLLDDMFYESGAELPMRRFIVPRVEVELAFILARPLRGPAVTLPEVLAATDHVVPALEIIDARIQQIDPATGRPRRVMDTISDNAANAAIVVGGPPLRPRDVDLRWVSALLYCNGTIEESGVAAAVLNHPANGVVWLANKLAQYGVGLEAGETILAGSFTRPVHAAAGDLFRVDYGAFGVITCRFA
jgi:2-oxo-hept-3-ene-1,7-dioate hydratase